VKLEEAYQVLGVVYKADLKTVKKAYRSLMFKYHPDVSTEPNSLEISRKINRAYEIVCGKAVGGPSGRAAFEEKVFEYGTGLDKIVVTQRELLMAMYLPRLMKIAQRLGLAQWPELETFAAGQFNEIFDRAYYHHMTMPDWEEGDPMPATADGTVSFRDMMVEMVVRLMLNNPSGPIMASDLESIHELDLADSVTRSVADLAYFRNLRNLDVSFTMVCDFEPLQHLTQLEVLAAVKCEAAGQPLRLPGLKELYIGYCGLADFGHLRHLTGLELLDISSNRLSEISSLGEFPLLTDLILYNNNVSHIEGIEKYAALQRLDLSLNPIRSIHALKHLPNLETLNLNWTRVDDFTPLLEMQALRILDVSYFSDAVLERHEAVWSALRERGVRVVTQPEQGD